MRSDAEVRPAIVLFDGVCNLCTASVQFIIRCDSRKRFRFASLQSPVAAQLLNIYEAHDGRLDSMILLTDGRTYRKSDAALRIARRLDGWWPLLSVLLLIPRPVRDAVYDWMGRWRYRMFGRREVCWIPSPQISDRFLEPEPPTTTALDGARAKSR